MITHARIGTLFRADAGNDLFDELARIYPAGVGGGALHAFSADLPIDDPRVRQLLGVLEAAGYRPWTDRRTVLDRRHEFGLQYVRLYNDGDLRELPYLELSPPTEAHLHDTPRREDGLIRLLHGYLDEKIDLGFTMTNWYVIPNRVKQLLEKGGLIGLQFRSALLIAGTYADADAQPIPWETYGEPWWELDTDRTMPPLSDSMTFADSSGNILRERDFSNGFHRREGLYMHPELHYRASTVAKMPQFDLARTSEPFGNRKGYDRLDCAIVASNGFYRFFTDHGLKTGWLPVRIDPD